MKLGFISPSLSRKLGGIFEIECSLAHELVKLGVDLGAMGLDDSEWENDRHRWSGVPAAVFPVQGPGSFGYSRELGRHLDGCDFDLLHLHALWMHPSLLTARWGRRNRKPYFVTPNGMLEPWALANSRWKKKLAGALYERSMLKGAACLQANTHKELKDFHAYGLRNPVAIIPNGVEMPEEVSEGLKVESRRSGEKKILLFLGRLHPKKGLPHALRAWAEIGKAESEKQEFEEWQFVIAGWDQGGHEAELKALATELGIRWADVRDEVVANPDFNFQPSEFQLLFTGPAFGEQKKALLRRADAFILPSFSEGLPMSVLEAWSYGLPVLMTDHCNLPEGFAAEAAIRIGTEPQSIASGLASLLCAPSSSLLAMGQRGRCLVEERFTWPQVAAQMKEVYEWVLGGGAKPGCVIE